MRELGAAGALSNRPNVRRTRLEAVVDLHIAPAIEPHPEGVQSNPRVAFPSLSLGARNDETGIYDLNTTPSVAP